MVTSRDTGQCRTEEPMVVSSQPKGGICGTEGTPAARSSEDSRTADSDGPGGTKMEAKSLLFLISSRDTWMLVKGGLNMGGRRGGGNCYWGSSFLERTTHPARRLKISPL